MEFQTNNTSLSNVEFHYTTIARIKKLSLLTQKNPTSSKLSYKAQKRPCLTSEVKNAVPIMQSWVQSRPDNKQVGV
jgi:hypothetical protein